MKNQVSAFLYFISVVLIYLGFESFTASNYDPPAIPAGWIIGLIFTIASVSMLIASLVVVFVLKRKQFMCILISVLSFLILGIGLRGIINNPLELSECPCPPLTFGKSCLPCPDCSGNSEGCNDGKEGNGECICDMGWSGTEYRLCSETFTGAECSQCKRGWTGIHSRISPMDRLLSLCITRFHELYRV